MLKTPRVDLDTLVPLAPEYMSTWRVEPKFPHSEQGHGEGSMPHAAGCRAGHKGGVDSKDGSLKSLESGSRLATYAMAPESPDRFPDELLMKFSNAEIRRATGYVNADKIHASVPARVDMCKLGKHNFLMCVGRDANGFRIGFNVRRAAIAAHPTRSRVRQMVMLDVSAMSRFGCRHSIPLFLRVVSWLATRCDVGLDKCRPRILKNGEMKVSVPLADIETTLGLSLGFRAQPVLGGDAEDRTGLRRRRRRAPRWNTNMSAGVRRT